MSLAVLHSRALAGMDAPEVTVEVHLSGGLPSFTIVGLPDAEVKESLDRVRALRAGRDGNDATPSCGAKQGVLSEQWQRPELYDSFYPRHVSPAVREAAE